MTFLFGLFHRFVLRDVRANWVRTLLTIFGIALGVSVYLAISIANDTALTRFRQTVGRISGKANIELMSLSGRGLNQEILRELTMLSVIGVKVTPLIDEHVIITGKKTDTATGHELVQLLGIDMLADPDFKTYQEDAIEADEASHITSNTQENPKDNTKESKSDVSVFTPRAVLVGGKLAARYHLAKGDQFEVLVDTVRQQLTVAGVLSDKGLGGAYSGNLIVADIALAQDILHWQDKVSRIEVIAPPENLAQVQEKIHSIAPGDVLVGSPDTRSEQAHKMTRSFEYNLLALTLIALMVGMFLIYNTMTITVLRRRPEIGILRALGVERSVVWQLFLLEAMALGFAGTLSGLALGGLMASGALKAVAQTFQFFYFKIPMEQVSVDPWQYFIAFLIGMALTLAAAFPPLYEAAAVAPAEATKRASQEAKVRSGKSWLFAAGVLCLILTYIFALQKPIYGFPAFGYVAALASIIGTSLMTPLLLSLLLPAVASPLAAIFGAEGRIAARSLSGTLGRTAVASASLMIGIAMMVALAIMISSFRHTVMAWIDQSFEADFWLQSQARAAGAKDGRLDESVIARVAAVKGVAAAEGFVDRRIIYDGMDAFLAAADFDVLAKYGNQLFVSGRTSADVCSRLTGNRAIISEPFAVRRNLKAGDNVVIDTPKGKIAFAIEDVYYDYASDLGYVIIPRPVYKSIYGESSVSNVAIYLDKGANASAIRSQIMQAIGGKTLVTLNNTSELRHQAILIFDRTFAITYALHTIAVTVAILSVMNALFALTLESKREFAILRYVGAQKSQLAKIVYLQAALLGLFGNIFGIALGYILSLLLVHVINKQSFGWSVQYSVPYDFIAQSSLLVVLTAVLSAILPARLAARTLAPAEVHDE